MAKKHKDNKPRDEIFEDYYDLKSDKVDELVAALKDEDTEEFGEVNMNIADITGDHSKKNYKRNGKQKQFDPYKTDFLGRIPTWVKALFIKWWFFGVICYFVPMGLGIYVTDVLDLLVLTGIITGLVIEILVNPIFRYMEHGHHEYSPYIMFPFPLSAFWTFFTNIIYYVIVIYGTNVIYGLINVIMISFDPESYFGMEPLTFGLFTLIVDMAFIGVKDLFVFLIKKLRRRKVVEDV